MRIFLKTKRGAKIRNKQKSPAEKVKSACGGSWCRGWGRRAGGGIE